MVSELLSSLAAPAFAALLFLYFLYRRSREINGGEARSNAAANDGTAGGASSTHTSTEAQGMATSSGYDYEVFLSFRGPDTRLAFTDFLCNSLTDAGIRTFKDDESLRVGDEFGPKLLQAIKESKILIPIFSKGYASSEWCMKELVQMVKCQEDGRQKIMPIFYDVAPSEVRYQIKDYAKAFLSHEKKGRYSEETICQWKAALNVVGDLSGWSLHGKTDRREGTFAKKITLEVFNELKKANLVVSECFVNVDNHVNAIREKISAQTSETRIIGIHGMGGIGKTTIAKMIYNELANDFEHHCFLSNIRETSERKGIECLQHQLISEILKMEWRDIKNIDDGTKTIEERLCTKKVLLLLDDVDHKKHMNALVGKRNWFGTGSKLIITTRNEEVLEVPEVDDFYKVDGMNYVQSLQLFSKHAFKSDSPLPEYTDQSNRAIGIAKGLPLALEVIGSLLQHTEKEMWDATLKMLESVPSDKVQCKLKISYDALDFRQKRIFLDIACLFIGYNKDIMVQYWDESIFFPKEAMKVLQNMSLIKINEDNEVWMHDQLRDLGREMVHEKSDTKIEKQSRVWDSEEGLNLLRRHKGAKEVEALRLKLDHQRQYHFTYEGFESLSNIRFLEVDGSKENFYAEERLLWHESPLNVLPTNVFKENSDLLPQLRWLSWHKIPPTFKITNFFMENVVILDLSRSEITHDWKGWSHMKVIKNLKVLDLSSCSIRRLPDELGRDLASLEYLYLKGCGLLERLPDSIGKMESLIELDISNTGIKELPDSIGNLTKLKVVNMWHSSLRKIPDAFWAIETLEKVVGHIEICIVPMEIGNSISRNQSLRILILRTDINALPMLPESLIELELSCLYMDKFPDLSNLTNLKELNLWFGPPPDYDVDSDGLVGYPIPPWIANLSKLEDLAVRSSYVTAILTDLSLLSQLKALDLRCRNLSRLPRLPSSLLSLILENCESLCSMEDLSNLKKLSSLHISGAALVEIQGLGCLENLYSLQLSGLGQVEILPDLSKLNKLRSLVVSNCGNLVEIQGELPRFMDTLRIGFHGSSQQLPDLSSLMGKQEVEIVYGNNLNGEAILRYGGKNPRELVLEGFEQLQILPDLELTSLQVRRCVNLIEIQGELPQSLEELVILLCESLEKLPDLSSLKALQKVDIEDCNKLKGDAILGFTWRSRANLWENLRYLRICGLGQVEILPDLSDLNKLRYLKVIECRKLAEIQGELPESLEELEIYNCESLQKLPDLSCLKGLQRVDIAACKTLNGEAILGFAQRSQANMWENLLYLEICDLEQVQILPDLSNLNNLRKLHIENWGELVEIQGELPESLEVLEISSCESLQKLPDLSRLNGLQMVEIYRCGKLNVEAISWLCSKKSVKFMGGDRLI